MKKIYFFSILELALLPIVQNKFLQTSEQTFNGESLTSRGGGQMFNSTTDSLKQSLEALSADMAAHGMSINLTPVAPNEYTPAMNEEEELPQKSCVEITPAKKPVPFIFEKPKGFRGFFNPFYPGGINHIYYEHTFKYLIWAFNYALEQKEQMVSLSFGSYINSCALMKEQELQQSIARAYEQEGACDSTAANCHFDMRGYIYSADRVVKSGTVSYAKNITPIPDFHDVSYSGDKIDPGFDDYIANTCNNTDSCTDDTSALYYYVYYINGINYENCKFPVIVLAHAGGFSDCSTLTYEDSLCRVLARKGFVVFCVEYRRGRIKTSSKRVTAQQQLAAYRASQDMRGAIRSIIKRQLRIAYNHFPYQIDTSLIFVVGQSAGALAMGTAVYYPKQEMIDSIFPVPAGEIAISTALGPIDADFYYGEPTIDYRSCIKGFCSMWGGFAFPQSVSVANRQYEFLTQDGTIPLNIPFIGFQGYMDPVFPYPKKYQSRYYPDNTLPDEVPYTIETNCLINSPFKVYNFSNPLIPDYRIECSNDIYNILKAHSVPTLMYLDCNMGHGLSPEDPITGFCPSDFGVAGNLTTDQVNEYLASRAAFFFQAIMNGTAGSLGGYSRFFNCEDMRYSADTCATAANNACTTNLPCNLQ